MLTLLYLFIGSLENLSLKLKLYLSYKFIPVSVCMANGMTTLCKDSGGMVSLYGDG